MTRAQVLSIAILTVITQFVNAQTIDELARRPIVVKEIVERQVVEQRVVRGMVPTYERYGLFGRKCRIVYRERSWTESSVRTVAEEVQRVVVSVANIPNNADAQGMLSLDAPRSAGAIVEGISGLLDNEFKTAQFPMIRQNTNFPINYNSTAPASDGVLYQFVINRDVTDPRIIQFKIFAFDQLTKTKVGSQPYADTKKTQLDAVLLTK
jgi:hypothetical protein